MAKDPRDANYYRSLMNGSVRTLYEFVNEVVRLNGAGTPLTAPHAIRDGGKEITPFSLLTKLNGEFEFLEKRLRDGDFEEAVQPEMRAILSVWRTWENAGKEDSWLVPQPEFATKFFSYVSEYMPNKSWIDTGTGLIANTKHANMTLLTSLLMDLQKLCV